MLYQTVDVGEVNRLLQRDFPEADATEFMANPLNVCLTDGESGTFFCWRGPGIYEVHVFFGCRGKEALKLGHEKLDWMQERYAARLFWALVPEKDRKTKMFTRFMGWKSLGTLPTAQGPCELFVKEMTCLQH